MPRVETAGSWLSAHLFFKGQVYSAECDRVILDVVEPFVRRCQQQGWMKKYFFIRYSERGPHVRLRFYGDRETLKRAVWPALEAHVRATLPDALRASPRAETTTQEAPSPDDTSSVLWVPYEPEIDRYGGPDGVALAEKFFHASSEAALAFLKQFTGEDHSARLGKGLLAMVVLVYAFLPKRAEAASFFQDYGTGYLRTLTQSEERQSSWLGWFNQGFDRQTETLLLYIETAWDRLEAGESLTETLDRYYQHLCTIRQHFARLHAEGRFVKQGVVPATWRQSVGMIIPSYLHMMNNRLGLSIPEESYLAHLITRALQQTVEQSMPEPPVT